jgi:hypothetical protein
MLLKLLKYDFRAMWKQFAIIWPTALVIGLVNRFTLFRDERWDITTHGMAGTATMLLFIGVLTAMGVVTLVFVMQRFYKGLLGEEGYLMHTLPVEPWQLVTSKFLCAIVTFVLSTAMAGLALLLMLPLDIHEIFNWKLWGKLLTNLWENINIPLQVVKFSLLTLTGLMLFLCILYLSMSLGHLFQRHRVLMSVVAFFTLEIVGSMISDLLAQHGVDARFDLLAQHGVNVRFDVVMSTAQFWIALGFNLVPAALCFGGSCWILKHRLNLE